MHQVAPNIYMMDGLRVSNVYLLVSAEGLTLVDTGMGGEGKRILDQLEKGGFALSLAQHRADPCAL